jgi:DNA-directed RNA polymerase specialized sigma24 family protein
MHYPAHATIDFVSRHGAGVTIRRKFPLSVGIVAVPSVCRVGAKTDDEQSGVNFEAREALGRIQTLLDGMKDKHRAVFVLRHVEGMDLHEIATGLDISLATVKRYLVKATRTIEHAVSRDTGLQASLSGVLLARERGGDA